jgi:hypothetical protein
MPNTGFGIGSSKRTNGAQIPGEYNQLFEEIYLWNDSDITLESEVFLKNEDTNSDTNIVKNSFLKIQIEEFSNVLDSVSGVTTAIGKMKIPFSFKWGEGFKNFEKSILDLSKNTDARITDIEYFSDKKILTVEKIPQKFLDRSLFVFENDTLRSIQLNYGDASWTKEDYSDFYEKIKENMSQKYGEGIPINMFSKYIENISVSYNGMQWADKTMGINLFLFNATHLSQKYQTIVLRYNAN